MRQLNQIPGLKHTVPLVLLVVIFMALSRVSYAGWFSDTDFYVVVQQTPSGQFVDGWVVQGAPKNSNGVYIFTIYWTKIEKRIPIQSAVVTKIGPDENKARGWLVNLGKGGGF
jgi:hypothetical protein